MSQGKYKRFYAASIRPLVQHGPRRTQTASFISLLDTINLRMSGPPKTREPATTMKALVHLTGRGENFHPLHAVSFVLLLLLPLLVMLYIGSGV
jgi:hypothetical protein